VTTNWFGLHRRAEAVAVGAVAAAPDPPSRLVSVCEHSAARCPDTEKVTVVTEKNPLHDRVCDLKHPRVHQQKRSAPDQWVWTEITLRMTSTARTSIFSRSLRLRRRPLNETDGTLASIEAPYRPSV
jgi:hypothetical protein